jgi:hypothetical protein
MADRNPLPWFKYDAQFLNEELDGLSDAQQGAYHRLVRRLWTRGPLPEMELARLAGESWGAIQPLFAAQCDAFSVSWLEVSRESARRTVEQRSLAGRSSAVQRPLKTRSTKAKRPLNGSETTVERAISLSPSTSSSTSDSPSLSQGVQGEAKDERFDLLWKTFEGKGAKSKAREYWLRLAEEDRADISAKAPAYCASTSGDRLAYRKNLEGWINPAERRWEAPIITPRGTAMQVALHSADVPPEAYSEQ